MDRSTKRERLLNKLERAWRSLRSSYAGLTNEQMQRPGVTGEWSVKDILGHISWWEEEAIKHLPTILQGGRPGRYSVEYGGIDAFNALMSRQRGAETLARVQQRLEDTHAQLIEYLHSIPDEQFASDTRFYRRLKLDTYGHYAIHEGAIWDWRRRTGTA